MMKKILSALVFTFALIFSLPQVQAASPLDYLEGSWYDANGNLFAIIHNGALNGYPMNVITMAGDEGNFAAAVQVSEQNGLRNVPLEYSYVAKTDAEKSNPFFRPTVRINGIAVHKEWFTLPQNLYSYLNGRWLDADNNVIAMLFSNGTFNSYPMTFISFYGTANHFNTVFKINDHGSEKFFGVTMQDGTLSLHRIGEGWEKTGLHK